MDVLQLVEKKRTVRLLYETLLLENSHRSAITTNTETFSKFNVKLLISFESLVYLSSTESSNLKQSFSSSNSVKRKLVGIELRNQSDNVTNDVKKEKENKSKW